jgi:aldose 1-epimerase
METVSLAQGKWRLELVPEIGGSISLCTYDGQDIMRRASLKEGAAAEARDMACFPLVPFSNRIEHGIFTIYGERIELPRNMDDHPHALHGQGWRGAWEVEAQEEGRAILLYRHEPDSWPWRYESRQDFSFTPDSLVVRLGVTNLAERPMPAGLGLHPYFPKGEGATLTTEVAYMWASTAQQIPIRLIDLPRELDFSRGLKIADLDLDHCFAEWGKSAVIEWPGQPYRVNMQGDDNLDFLVVYTPPHEDFFCVEGVENMNNAFNWMSSDAYTGAKILAPGESHSVTTVFQVEPSAA